MTLTINHGEAQVVFVGEVAHIRVFLQDETGGARTGEEPEISIERLSDALFWNGAAFDLVGYYSHNMTELEGNAHYEGVYEYIFNVSPGTQDSEMFEFHVKANGDNFRGRFSGNGYESLGLSEDRFPIRDKNLRSRMDHRGIA